MLYNIILYTFASVFHGIRFKVKRLFVVMTGNFFYIRPSGGFFCSLVLLFPRAAQIALKLCSDKDNKFITKSFGLK